MASSRTDSWLLPAVAAVVAVTVNMALDQTTELFLVWRWIIAAAAGVLVGMAVAAVRRRSRRSDARD